MFEFVLEQNEPQQRGGGREYHYDAELDLGNLVHFFHKYILHTFELRFEPVDYEEKVVLPNTFLFQVVFNDIEILFASLPECFSCVGFNLILRVAIRDCFQVCRHLAGKVSNEKAYKGPYDERIFRIAVLSKS